MVGDCRLGGDCDLGPNGQHTVGKVIDFRTRREARIKGVLADLPTPIITLTIVTRWKPKGEVTLENYGELAATQFAQFVDEKIGDALQFDKDSCMVWSVVAPE